MILNKTALFINTNDRKNSNDMDIELRLCLICYYFFKKGTKGHSQMIDFYKNRYVSLNSIFQS